MRFLLLPASNTLSHLAKCLALRDVLLARGHEVHLAVTRGRSAFLRRLGVPHELVPDLQEADGAAAPTFAWFRPARFEGCVRAELALIRRLRPDRVLGVFRFTGAVAARLAGVPYDALVCGCMTPACDETLGFAPGEEGEALQAEALAFFRRAAAARVAPALARLGLPAATDAWELLLGDRTFLWDTPEFQPLRPREGLLHVGPVTWSGWPTDGSALERLAALRPPLAVVALGTGGGHDRVAARLVELLLRLDFSVAVAGGGGAPGPAAAGARVAHFDFLPVEAALERAAVVACHGGQGIVLEALRQRVPLLVMPFQPEQAQNGRCLERLGCGLRLEHGAPAHPDAPRTEDAFLARPVETLARRVARFLGDPGGFARRAAAARMLARCGGVAALAAGLERPLSGASARRVDRRLSR
jgi:UDP:flavonoid glycosyltransferase YjiC (YdhE family)